MGENQKTLLLVEEEVIIALQEAQQLQKEGYTIIQAFTGEEAIAKVKAAKPSIDLILMDINLGAGMDGTQAAQEILKEHDIPIVFLSSHTETEVVAKTEKITSYGYVVKNTGITVLAASIKMAFKLHTAHQALRGANESLSQEIAERKQAEEKLQRSEARLKAQYENSPDIIMILDRDYRYISINKVLFGPYTVEGLIGQDAIQPLHPLAREQTRSTIERCFTTGMSQEFEHLVEDGKWVRARVVPLLSNGIINQVMIISTDITAHKQAEERLRYQANLLTNVTDAIIATDIHFNIEYWNSAAEALYGWSAADVISHPLSDFVKTEYINETRQSTIDALMEQGFWKGEVTQNRRDGTRFPVLSTVSLVKDDTGRPIGAIAINRDITERKQTEEALRESEDKFRYVFNSAAIGISFTELSGETNVNQSVCDMLGYSQSEYQHRKWQEITHPEDIEFTQKMINALISGEKETARFTKRFIHKNGSIVWTELGSAIRRDQNGKPQYLLTTISDITEQKRMEEELRQSEGRFRSLFENTTIGLYRTTPEGKILLANPELIAMCGYSSFEELATRNLEESEYEPGYPRSSFRQQIESTGVIRGLESAWKRKDGSTFFVRENARAIRDAKGNTLYYEGTVEDISSRKQAEDALRQALAEKELLMRELQHRVKNSLNTAASLISLGQDRLPNDQSQAILSDTGDRLRTMATLYDQLNQAGRIDRIDLHNYLHILIDRLAQAYLTAESPVKIETRLPALELETKQAMPLGLIVNELVTNALKYAFPAGQTGIIRVEVDESGKEITLCVADNGVGLATSSPQGDHSGLGLMLVELLTQQLGGKLVINGENGVTAQVKFKKN